MTLTKEDWESDEAGLSAVVLADAIVLVLVLLVLAFAYAFADAIVLVLVLACACAVDLAITLSDQKSSIWYYVFRFPGALWHHWTVRK